MVTRSSSERVCAGLPFADKLVTGALVTESDTEVEEQTELTKRDGPGPPRVTLPHLLERGTLIGRYVVMSLIGEGGMGVVYSAFDPELDRKVAIKLLQARSGADDQAWLLREAQAMARLSHPNVIAVHDVGTVPGDRVFVAMEYVDGVTLRAWLKEVRPWREVLRVLIAAGHGLAAAHASGLVHRDFKPDNVLVGNDGRVRVMDFGLARLQLDEGAEPHAVHDHEIDTSSPLSASLTVAGTLVGTPAYMAPELNTGAPADARSDQFSFGVALYEALFRVRPFDKSSPRGARAKQPTDSKVPARIQRVVMRALSPVRDERYTSLDELLAELSVDVAAKRRRALVGAGMVAAIAITAGVGGLLSARSHREMCTGIDQRLAGVWDVPIKRAIKGAFDATKLPFAASAYTGLERALDGYTKSWLDAAVDSCKATRVRGDQTEEELALRSECLDRRLDEVRALTELLSVADADLVGKGDQVVAQLEHVSRCANVAALRAPGRVPSEPRARVAEMNKQLAEAKAAVIAGKYFPSIMAAKKVAAIAEEIHWPPAKAEGLLLQCTSLASAGTIADAQTACTDAVWTAVKGHADEIVAGAALSEALLASQHQLGEARIWMGLANSVIARGSHEAYLDLRVLEVEAVIAAQAGDTQAAIAAQQKALAVAGRMYGADNPLLWNEEEVFGLTLMKAGAYDQATPHYERALALHQQSVGPDHPDIALILTNLGACYAHAGEIAKARATYERSVAIREHTDGKDSPLLVMTLNNMADALIKSGDPASALTYLDRARELGARTLGKASPMYHALQTTLAEALAAANRPADARAAYDEAIALETSGSPFLGQTLNSRALFELAAKQYKDAAAFAQHSITVTEAANGQDSPDLWQPLTTLAHADLELGHAANARPLLERALAIGEKAQVSPSDLAPTRELMQKLQK